MLLTAPRSECMMDGRKERINFWQQNWCPSYSNSYNNAEKPRLKISGTGELKLRCEKQPHRQGQKEKQSKSFLGSHHLGEPCTSAFSSHTPKSARTKQETLPRLLPDPTRGVWGRRRFHHNVPGVKERGKVAPGYSNLSRASRRNPWQRTELPLAQPSPRVPLLQLVAHRDHCEPGEYFEGSTKANTPPAEIILKIKELNKILNLIWKHTVLDSLLNSHPKGSTIC